MNSQNVNRLWLAAVVMILIGASLVSAQTGSLDYRANPVYGSKELSAGFSNDPLQLPEVQVRHPRDTEDWIQTDDEVDVQAQDIGQGCTGYTSEAPTYRLQWTGRSSRLRIFFESNADTTLIINDPNGAWLCSDDSYNTTNPTITFTRPLAGQYDIWVGSYSRERATGVLTISERDLRPAGAR